MPYWPFRYAKVGRGMRQMRVEFCALGPHPRLRRTHVQSLLSGMLAKNGSTSNGSASGASTAAWPSTPALSRHDAEELERGIAGAAIQRNVPCTRAELLLPLRLYGSVR